MMRDDRMPSFKDGDKCPICSKPLERKSRMHCWKGEFFDGMVCTDCNALWPVSGEEMPPLRPVANDNVQVD